MIRKFSKVFIALLVFMPIISWAEWGLNMPRGVTPVSKEIYDLHMTIFWICCVIALLVFGVLIYALIFHRKSRGYKAAEFHEHISLEIVWAVLPFCILVVMAVPATRVLMAMEDTAEADVTIKITGFQWKWKYEYLDQGIHFMSNLSTPYEQITDSTMKKDRWYLLEVDNEVVVPINKKIRFLVTSNDVIHSWWVPELGIKRDAIPGFIHESWARIEEPGIYRGQCAELCGLNHAYMPIVVRAVSSEEFNQWVEKRQKPRAAVAAIDYDKTYSKEAMMTQGKKVYDKLCVVCHKPDGTGQPPVFPALKASSVAVGEPISRHIDIILNGVSGTAMQAFANQLDDVEVAAVVTYERNAWDNDTGDVIQPKAVKEQRKS